MPAIAIQADDPGEMDVHADTTFDIALEAFSRGHEVRFFHPSLLRLCGTDVLVRSRQARNLKREQGNHADLAPPVLTDLRTMDAVLVRQDPPFDMAYITSVHILEKLVPDVLVLNSPRAIRDAPEKLSATCFPELVPPTLITGDTDAIYDFRAEHGDLVIKPLYGNGGEGVFRTGPGDGNFASLLEMFFKWFREPAVVQKFIPAVSAGDKRIILLDGKAAGAVNRVPPPGETRSNLHAGGRAQAVELTPADRKICDTVGPVLARQGLVFAGIDVIGGLLTEINVTSPTGVQEIRRLGGADISALFVDWIENRLAGMSSARPENGRG